MAEAVSVRLETATRSGHAGQRAHDMRSATPPGYVDTSRSHENEVVFEPPTPAAMVAEAERRRYQRYERGELKRRPGRLRSDATIAIEGIVTFGSEAQETITALDSAEQARRYQAAADAIAAQLGTTVAGLTIHRDESAPHAHVVLHGYAHDGKPVSRKLTKSALSQAQDAAATAYTDLGITRGTPISQRIQAGEDRSATVHRTVAELHRDLPAELEQARKRAAEAQAEAEKQEKRLQNARDQLAAAEEQEAQIAKRVDRYERRLARAQQKLEDAQAELERLARLDPGAHAQERADAEASARAEAERGHDQLLDAILAAPSAGAGSEPPHDQDAALWAATTHQVQRYGVQMQTTEQRARVPPQEASARQTAAALYRYGRDQRWEFQWFDVNEQVAEHVIEMAAEDGRLEHITMIGDEQQRMLEEALERYRPDTGPSPG